MPPTESVWDYPRPPAVEASSRRVRVEALGGLIVDTTEALRVLETSHPPVYYVPASAVAPGLLVPSPRRTFCEFKGAAVYWTLRRDGREIDDAAWSYPAPTSGYEQLVDHLAFYPARVDGCWLDDERVVAQEGDFYGGWVTSEITGPFKGGPGTMGW